jgi:hypothetical protein
MECRYVTLIFSRNAPTFTLDAWRVNYPWVDTDSGFTSDNQVPSGTGHTITPRNY